MTHRLEGAEWIGQKGLWRLPMSQYGALSKVLPKIPGVRLEVEPLPTVAQALVQVNSSCHLCMLLMLCESGHSSQKDASTCPHRQGLGGCQTFGSVACSQHLLLSSYLCSFEHSIDCARQPAGKPHTSAGHACALQNCHAIMDGLLDDDMVFAFAITSSDLVGFVGLASIL